MAGKKTVVYIEADADLIDFVRLILGRRGYNVVGAAGAEGVNAVWSSKPDLVLLELSQQGIDGWEVYRQLRTDPATRDIPVVVATGRALAVDRALGVHLAEVDGYLEKPFRPAELVRTVRDVLKRRG